MSQRLWVWCWTASGRLAADVASRRDVRPAIAPNRVIAVLLLVTPTTQPRTTLSINVYVDLYLRTQRVTQQSRSESLVFCPISHRFLYDVALTRCGACEDRLTKPPRTRCLSFRSYYVLPTHDFHIEETPFLWRLPDITTYQNLSFPQGQNHGSDSLRKNSSQSLNLVAHHSEDIPNPQE